MRRHTFRRTMAALAVAAAACLTPVATAAPAHATARQCAHYLSTKGWVGARTRNGCDQAAQANSRDKQRWCYNYFRNLGVKPADARKAVRLARR